MDLKSSFPYTALHNVRYKACGEFLGVKRSDEFYREVADKTAFEKVKAREHEFYK